MKSMVAVHVEHGQPLVVEEAEFPDPAPDQVLVRQFASGVNLRILAVRISPLPNRIIILERKAQRIDLAVAVVAARHAAVFLKLLANRLRPPHVRIERRHVRRRRSRRRAQDILQEPHAPCYRRSVNPVRGHRQHARLSQ